MSPTQRRSPAPDRARCSPPVVAFSLLLLMTASGLAGAQGAGHIVDEAPKEQLKTRTYDVLVDVRIVPTEKAAHVELTLSQPTNLVRELTFRVDPDRHLDFAGDGVVRAESESVSWLMPAEGGKLRWTLRIDHLRNNRAYDARAATGWALFRGDDLVPAARARTVKGATSRTRLRIQSQKGWKVQAPFPLDSDGTYIVQRDDRRFDRPTGWILAGKLRTTRATIAGCRVTISSPAGQRVRRLDQLALLRWTLPALRDVVGALPPSILVVGAGDPMVRGGLSGPGSLFLHADRPLISNDGTSPLLHEIMHVVMGARAGPDGDWVVEGLAELYSIELLTRSRTISTKRRTMSLARLAKRAEGAGELRRAESTGATTAKAAGVLVALDAEIVTRSGGEASLDDVVKAMAQANMEVTTDGFRDIAQSATGLDLSDFFKRLEADDATPSSKKKRRSSRKVQSAH